MKKTLKQWLAVLVTAVVVMTSFIGCKKDEETIGESSTGSETNEVQEESTENPVEKELEAAMAVASHKEDIAKFKEINSEAIAWLSIPDTTINEVVVQDPNGNDKYHRMNNIGEYDFNGCYYADYECRVSGDAKQISPNIVIYGHSMDDNPEGEDFSQLKKFLDKDFAEKHPYIYLSNENNDYIYEVFSTMYTNSDDFYYIDCNFRFTTMESLVKEAKAGSIYNYPDTPEEGDKILTLSTCTYKFGDASNIKQRYVVFAKLVTEDELAPETITLSKNENVKMPVFK